MRYFLFVLALSLSLTAGYALADAPTEAEVIEQLAVLEAQLAEYEQREVEGQTRAEMRSALEECRAQLAKLTE